MPVLKENAACAPSRPARLLTTVLVMSSLLHTGEELFYSSPSGIARPSVIIRAESLNTWLDKSSRLIYRHAGGMVGIRLAGIECHTCHSQNTLAAGG